MTAQNLEDKIHFYQQDPRGIAIEARLNPDDKTHSLRKRFTQLVVQLLQDKVKKLPFSQMSPLVKQLLKDLQAKDIQINVNNALENGRLMPTQVNFDGTPWAFRIIDPRQIVLTATFSF